VAAGYGSRRRIDERAPGTVLDMDAQGWQYGALVVVLVVAVLLFAVVRRARPRPVPAPALTGADGTPPRAGVVVHGVKVDDSDARRRQIEVTSGRLGWAEPLWLETTADDHGRAQTRAALASGTDAVLAFGGDGTARIVAEVLAGTGVPMGLLPAGTGNLLARNLGIPPNRLESSLHIALTGRQRTIDVGRVEIRHGSASMTETFLVMAGLGFDAEIMAGADPILKRRFGWGAYVVAGLGNLRGRRTAVTITVDDHEPQHRRVRAVVVGNCGMLQGGMQLMPGALLDDGWLDVVVLSPRGVLGWLPVAGAVIARRSRGSVVEHLRCRSIRIEAERPMAAQLDGDPAGMADVLVAGVQPLALTVRVPG
jgi:diacylglycerol kinase (ATP)